MTAFAGIVLDPSTLGAWLVIGVICGWLASKVMEDATYGTLGDVLIGSLGALIGGCVFGLLVTGNPAFWGTVALAFVGACIFIGGARVIAYARGA